MAITVSELATMAGVPAHVVRFYTREGLLKPRRNRTNGYRLYSEADVTRLRFIRRAKSLGFTLDDIGQILRDSDRRQSPCPRTRSLILKRLQEAEERLSALRELQNRMKQAVEIWRRMPDRAPDGQSVCHLIEAVTVDDDDLLDRALD